MWGEENAGTHRALGSPSRLGAGRGFRGRKGRVHVARRTRYREEGERGRRTNVNETTSRSAGLFETRNEPILVLGGKPVVCSVCRVSTFLRRPKTARFYRVSCFKSPPF
eukprot:scaffold176906_cov35-Tisochrysis_lutea.AAC.1